MVRQYPSINSHCLLLSSYVDRILSFSLTVFSLVTDTKSLPSLRMLTIWGENDIPSPPIRSIRLDTATIFHADAEKYWHRYIEGLVQTSH